MSDTTSSTARPKAATTVGVSVGGTYPVEKITGASRAAGAWMEMDFDLRHTRGATSVAIDGKLSVNGPSRINGQWNPDNVPSVSGAIGLTGAHRFGDDKGMYGIGAVGVVATKAEPVATGLVKSTIDTTLKPLRAAYAKIDAASTQALQNIAATQATQLPQAITKEIVSDAQAKVSQQAAHARAALPNLKTLEAQVNQVSTVRPSAELSAYGAAMVGVVFPVWGAVEGDASLGIAAARGITDNSRGEGAQAALRIGHGLAHLPQDLPKSGQRDLARQVTYAPGEMEGGDWQINAHYQRFEGQYNASFDPSLQRSSGEAMGLKAMVALSGRTALTAGVEQHAPTTHTPAFISDFVADRTPQHKVTSAHIGMVFRF